MLSRAATHTVRTAGRRFASSATPGAKKATEKKAVEKEATKDVTAEAARGLKLYAGSVLAWYAGWVTHDAYSEHQHFVQKKGRRPNGDFHRDLYDEPYYYGSHGLRCSATTPLEAALHGAKRQQEVHAFQGVFWPVVVASRAFTSAVGYLTDALAPGEVTE